MYDDESLRSISFVYKFTIKRAQIVGHFVDLTDCSLGGHWPCHLEHRASHRHTIADTFRHLIHSNDKTDTQHRNK